MADFFRTTHFQQKAAHVERMSRATLRRTGMEPQLEEAQRLGRKIVVMSLGDPGANGFPPHRLLTDCLETAVHDRRSYNYTTSFGLPELRERLKHTSLSDPGSVSREPSAYHGVETYLTVGGSEAAFCAIAPWTLGDGNIAVHEFIFVIHTAATWANGGFTASYPLTEDARPDLDYLVLLLDGAPVRCAVATTIGNPIGSEMSESDIVKMLQIAQTRIQQTGEPLVLVIDPAYEGSKVGVFEKSMPLDPIEIAIRHGIETPMVVTETASKTHAACGLRLGCLRLFWPEHILPEWRADFIKYLETMLLPMLGKVPTLTQVAFCRLLERFEKNPAERSEYIEYLKARSRTMEANLKYVLDSLRSIKGVYLARYYEKMQQLSAYYLMFGFEALQRMYGSGHNQTVSFADFSLQTSCPMIRCVPSQSFLTPDTVRNHPAMIRVTAALTPRADADLFLESVAAYAKHLETGSGALVQVPL